MATLLAVIGMAAMLGVGTALESWNFTLALLFAVMTGAGVFHAGGKLIDQVNDHAHAKFLRNQVEELRLNFLKERPGVKLLGPKPPRPQQLSDGSDGSDG
jgi:hypothetical protein